MPGASTRDGRSFNGCWTCRVRRKKCDEGRPICKNCVSLHVSCHYNATKPPWMDGGIKQDEMALRLKRQVREQSLRRSRYGAGLPASFNEASALIPPVPSKAMTAPDSQNHSSEDLSDDLHCEKIVDGRVSNTPNPASPDTHLLAFHLEQIIPFLFPFYRPPVTQGGTAWILDLMIKSPVVRQAAVCQSSYFLSLPAARPDGVTTHPIVNLQVDEALATLRQALQLLTDSPIHDHLHGAVRVMTSILQMQRFEIAISRFENCNAHLNGAVAIFKHILDSQADANLSDASEIYDAVVRQLGPESWICPAQPFQMANAEQNAFRFSTALLLFDDIVAAMMLRQRPKLYDMHESLLGETDGRPPCIDLEGVLGCQNWVLVLLGQVISLDASRSDYHDIIRPASTIRAFLRDHLQDLATSSSPTSMKGITFLDTLSPDRYMQVQRQSSRTHMVTHVWAMAVLIYLYNVVPELQTGNDDVRSLIDETLQLLANDPPPTAVLRAMLWPICMSGCSAHPEHHEQIRALFTAFQPKEVYGSSWKAFEIVERTWCGNSPKQDLMACLRHSDGGLVLLV